MVIVQDIRKNNLVLSCANHSDPDDGPACGGSITH